jgi:hypothetical protein
MALPRPVFALPGRTLYRVLVCGRGISLPVEGDAPICGFFVSVFVAARSADEAERDALTRVRARWQRYADRATGELELSVEESEALAVRFVLRPVPGFVFFQDEDTCGDALDPVPCKP